MKALFPLFVFCFLFFQTNDSIHAQNSKKFDSIVIRNVPKYDLTFRINDALLKKISLTKSNPKLVQIKGKHVFGDFGSGLLTLVSGVGIENTKEDVDLKLTSKLKFKDEKHNWTIDLFVKGMMEKQRSRHSTESGGFSMSIDRYARVHWESGASGEIKKNNNKIGEFVLIKTPKFDKFEKNDPLEFLSDSVGEVNEQIVEKSSDDRTYVIYGELYNQNFSVIASVKNKRYWLFQDKKLKAVLQLPLEHRLIVDKNTYALLDPDMSTTEDTYWLKLALYNAVLSGIVTKTEYNW